MLDFNHAERQDGPKVIPINAVAAFCDAMRQEGLVAPEIVADGRLHRFTVQGDKARSNNGWYVMHDEGNFAAGAFGSWKTGDQHKWCSVRESDMTDAERAEYRRRMDELQAARKAEEDRVHAECAAWCEREWRKAPPAPADHPYLARKGIAPHGARAYKDALLIPIIRQGAIVGMQFIAPDGTKTFKTGSRIKGGHFHIAGAEPAILCEGFATGASIAAATGRQVIVAFTCSNLLEVARAFNPATVAADNDHRTEGNPGLAKGREAAEAVGAQLVHPHGITGTDFNDLHAEKGIEAVRAAFGGAKKASRFKQVDDLMDKEFRPINWAIEGLLPEGLAVLSGPPKLGKSWLSLDFCLAIATGGLAAGHFATEKGSVLLCAMEDNERRLKSRIDMRKGAGMKFALAGPLDFNVLANPKVPGFFYTTELPRLNVGGLQALIEFLDEHPDCKLIVLDTLAKVKPEAKGRGNAYEQDYNDMGALQHLALERRCAILVITHNRKTETDDVLQSISGSTGITGVMDTILILKRGRGASGASLFLTGRDVSEHTWAMEFAGEHGAWTVTGDYAEEGKDGVNSDLQTEVLDVLQNHFTETGRGLRLGQLFDAMGGEGLAPKKSNLSRTLGKLHDRGVLVKMHGEFIPKQN